MTMGFEVFGESGNAIINSTHTTYTCIQSVHSTDEVSYFNADLLPTDILVYQGMMLDHYYDLLEYNKQYALFGPRLLVYRETTLIPDHIEDFGLVVFSQTGEVLYNSSNLPLTFWQGRGEAALVFHNVQFQWGSLNSYISLRYSFPYSVNSAGVVSRTEFVTGYIETSIRTPLTGITTVPQIIDISYIPQNYNHPSVSPPLSRYL